MKKILFFVFMAVFAVYGVQMAQFDDISKIREHEVCISEPGVLVPWLLRRHGRKEQGGDRKVHSEPAGGGQNVRAAGDEGAFRPIHRGAHNKEMK